MPVGKITPALGSFLKGENCRAYTYLGAHPAEEAGLEGAVLRTWAPNAKSISVVGSFNDWDRDKHPMKQIERTGVWGRSSAISRNTTPTNSALRASRAV